MKVRMGCIRWGGGGKIKQAAPKAACWVGFKAFYGLIM